jgi:hypothetical protein
MEQLRVPKLLAEALAAVSGAVVASLFGIEGTLIGAALVSLLVAPAEALYAHSLASAHKVARRSLVRRVGERAGASEEAASQAPPQPIRWQRVAVAAVVAFGIAVGAITVVEAVAKQPLASLVGSRSRPEGSTSVGVVVAGADRSAPPATRAPATSTTFTSSSGPAPPTAPAPVGVPTTTAPASTVPSTTATTTTTPSVQAPSTQRP